MPSLTAGTYRLSFSGQVAATFDVCDCEPSPFSAPVPSSPDDVLIDPAVVGTDTSALSTTRPVAGQFGPGSPIAIRRWDGSRWSDPLPWQPPTNPSNPDTLDPVALLESLATFDRGTYQLAFQQATDGVVYGVFFIDRDPAAPAGPTGSTATSTSTVSPDVRSARSEPGEVLDLRTIRTSTEPSDRLRLAVSGIGAPGLNAAHISGDGRYVLLFAPNVITILRPDGTIDGTFSYRTDGIWTGIEATLGPDDVVYLSESSFDEAGNETFRFSAIPASGANKGERVASALGTLPCVETWCGQVVVSPTGVGSAAAVELPFVSQDGAPSGARLAPLPTASTVMIRGGEVDPAFPSGMSFVDGTALITVTMPDGTVRTWSVLAPKVTVVEGTFGDWWLQPDGSIVGQIRTNDERRFLVDLYADGSSRGIELSPEASDAYAALRTGNSTTLVVQREGVGLLLTYPG